MLSDEEYTEALQDAIAAIHDLPYARSDVGDMAREHGRMEGRQEAIEAIRELIKGTTVDT
jgi:hypothetical protein